MVLLVAVTKDLIIDAQFIHAKSTSLLCCPLFATSSCLPTPREDPVHRSPLPQHHHSLTTTTLSPPPLSSHPYTHEYTHEYTHTQIYHRNRSPIQISPPQTAYRPIHSTTPLNGPLVQILPFQTAHVPRQTRSRLSP